MTSRSFFPTMMHTYSIICCGPGPCCHQKKTWLSARFPFWYGSATCVLTSIDVSTWSSKKPSEPNTMVKQWSRWKHGHVVCPTWVCRYCDSTGECCRRKTKLCLRICSMLMALSLFSADKSGMLLFISEHLMHRRILWAVFIFIHRDAGHERRFNRSGGQAGWRGW